MNVRHLAYKIVMKLIKVEHSPIGRRLGCRRIRSDSIGLGSGGTWRARTCTALGKIKNLESILIGFSTYLASSESWQTWIAPVPDGPGITW